MIYLYTCPTEVGAKLHDEINDQIAPCECVTWAGSGTDQTEVCFEAALSAGEKTALDALVAAHDPADASPEAVQLCIVGGAVVMCRMDGTEVTDVPLALGVDIVQKKAGGWVTKTTPGGSQARSRLADDYTEEAEVL